MERSEIYHKDRMMESLFIQQLQNDFSGVNHQGSPWLQGLRKEAMEQFLKVGLPSTRQEEWKYTNLQSLSSIPWRALGPNDHPIEENLRKRSMLDFDGGIRIVCLNGRYSESHSSLEGLPPGVVVESLGDLLRDHPDRLQPTLGRLAPFKEHPFVALNTAMMEDGAFVYIPKGVIVETPIQLIYLTVESGEVPIVSHPRTLVVADPDSQATVVESYAGDEGGKYFTNAVTEMILEENSVIEHYKIQQEGRKAFHIGAVHVHQERQSRLTTHSISIGSVLCRNDLDTVLDGEGAECSLYGLFVVSGNQHLDNHTAIDHKKSHGTSHELYKGILSDKADGVFNGKITIRPDAFKTNARQTNKNLLLSDGAIMNTKPLLEIFNNDVKCNHGATIGRLDENQVFYLRSRGLGNPEACGLLTYAFANELLEKVKILPIRSHLQKGLFSRLTEGRLDLLQQEAVSHGG